MEWSAFKRSGPWLAVAMVTSLAAVIYPTFDYDLYWHLANGREMWLQGRVINEDVFSFTRMGTRYDNPEWLAQLVFYLLWAAGGFFGLFVFKVIVALAVVWLLWQCLKALAVPSALAAVLIPLAVLCGFYRFIERPELFSLLGTALVVAVTICTRERFWSPRWLYVLPVVLACWEWLHGAIFGMTALAAAFCAENFNAWLGHRSDRRSNAWLRTLNRSVVATLIISLLNPYGLLSYGMFMGVITNAGGFANVSEWQPAGLRNFWLFFVLLLVGTGLLFRRRPLSQLTEILWFLGFGLLAWRYSRVTGVFAIAALPWLASAIWQTSRFRSYPLVVGAASTLLVAALFVHKVSPWSFVERRLHWSVLEDYIPAGAVRYALDNDLRGPLYNTGHFGGYLAFNLYPDHKIFQYNLPKVWGETYRYDPALLQTHGIEWAIVGETAEIEYMFQRRDWAYLYKEHGAVLVARRGGLNQELIARRELRVFSPNLSMDAIRRGLEHQTHGELFAFETSLYCSYKADNNVCPMLLQVLANRPTPYAWQAQWIKKVTRRQAAGATGLR